MIRPLRLNPLAVVWTLLNCTIPLMLSIFSPKVWSFGWWLIWIGMLLSQIGGLMLVSWILFFKDKNK